MNELARLERQTRLWNIDKAASNILTFIDGCAKETYVSDSKLRAAVERELITIGEALARAEDVDPELVNLISDVPGIIGLRNQLIHNYPRIIPERIWQIVTEHLPTLLAEVRALLTAGENPA